MGIKDCACRYWHAVRSASQLDLQMRLFYMYVLTPAYILCLPCSSCVLTPVPLRLRSCVSCSDNDRLLYDRCSMEEVFAHTNTNHDTHIPRCPRLGRPLAHTGAHDQFANTTLCRELFPAGSWVIDMDPKATRSPVYSTAAAMIATERATCSTRIRLPL